MLPSRLAVMTLFAVSRRSPPSADCRKRSGSITVRSLRVGRCCSGPQPSRLICSSSNPESRLKMRMSNRSMAGSATSCLTRTPFLISTTLESEQKPGEWITTRSDRIPHSATELPRSLPESFQLSHPHSFKLCQTPPHVIITNFPPEAIEYAHGGTTPISTLSVPAPSYAFACAVDPSSGNLAVTQDAGVSVYQDAQGTPSTYTDWAEPMRCSYDDSGNLFANTSDQLTELSKGSSGFIIMNFSKNETALSNVQWDGKYLAVEGRPGFGKKGAPAPMYRASVSGSTATIIHTLTLEVPRQKPDTTGSWIADHMIAQPVDRGKHVAIWAYPKGGNPLTLIPMTGRDIRATMAATVSLAH